MRREWSLFLAGIIAMPGVLSAQTAASRGAEHPRGTFAYNVNGIYQGEPMVPWEAEISVADSVAGGVRLTVVEYRSRRASDGFLYEYRLVLTPASGEFVVSHANRGRAPGKYDLAVRDGRIRGRIASDGATRTLDTTLAMPALPTFALGSLLASRPLTAGDTISIGAMPMASGVGLERVKPYRGVVRDDSLARYLAKSPEPVWVVKGDAAYPAEFWIAKNDRLVLKAVIPQGTDGTMTEEYAGRGW